MSAPRDICQQFRLGPVRPFTTHSSMHTQRMQGALRPSGKAFEMYMRIECCTSWPAACSRSRWPCSWLHRSRKRFSSGSWPLSRTSRLCLSATSCSICGMRSSSSLAYPSLSCSCSHLSALPGPHPQAFCRHDMLICSIILGCRLNQDCSHTRHNSPLCGHSSVTALNRPGI